MLTFGRERETGESNPCYFFHTQAKEKRVRPKCIEMVRKEEALIHCHTKCAYIKDPQSTHVFQ